MRYFATRIRAIDPKTGEMATWAGTNIQAISFGMARKWCDENGLGYCEIDGIIESEGYCKKEGLVQTADYTYLNN